MSNELAAYLYIKEYKEDENAELSENELEIFKDRSKKLIYAVNTISMALNEIIENTEEVYNAIVYDAGKKVYGESKEELRLYFKDLYLLLFEKVHGPRIPHFIMMFGCNPFIRLLHKRLDNPFGV